MGFKTTQEHELLRQQIREFAETEVKPYAFQWDKENYFPAEQVKMMAQKGWLGIPFPKEYGGMGLDALSYCLLYTSPSPRDRG